MVELVRLMILRGEIPAGGRMPEVQLAQRLRIGRSTLREVLRQLAGDGLLVANESGGMRVVRLDPDELAATVQVRAALESLSAGLAAERVRAGDTAPGSVRDLEVLADFADAEARTPAGTPALVADRTFHRAVDALAANVPCREALTRLWDRIIVATLEYGAPPQHAGRVDREHRGLLAAIAAGDPDEASAVARRHVLASLA